MFQFHLLVQQKIAQFSQTVLLKTNNTLVRFNIVEKEIKDIIDILNPNKSVGDDKISHRILKLTKQSISKPLVLLFNKSLHECIFPDLWKHGLII